ncbi:class I tRNA ligase family protein [Candidatus Nitrosocosmicus arcticus]|uniref:class I tRNA ligase family protein n=1 Tax=Candidatus Nitrosocosmicus arcticus TaxID=2035267 RepID=UPI001C95BA04|nr:class I tRNA ligase family protein [Candidatus Nitrosocosmicus arcticus]
MKTFENQVRAYYDDPTIKRNINEYFSDSENFQRKIGYVEGPPTMNGEPHLGHIRGRIIKDLWFRKSILEKKKMEFRPGWDSQGLPVELQAEKILGLTGNKSDNLRKVGIKKIVETCKKLILEYNKKWIEVDNLIGMSFDYEKGYWTYTDTYIEREWKYISKALEDGILKEWFRVVAYCPSCQTSLSNAEINQSYEQVEDPSFYYKVNLKDSETFLVVWTTMPFTLITDELVGVNPEARYLTIKVDIEGKKEKWIVSENRVKELMADLKFENYEVLDTFLGINLEGQHYIHPLLNNIPGLNSLASQGKIHFVVAENFVDVTTGSGIVHLSPANGEEDFEIATRRKIPIFVPIDDKVFFTKDAGKYKDQFVRDVDQIVVNDMRLANSVIKIGKLTHKYPTCWRSHHKIVWLARKEYFYMIDVLGDQPIAAASKVNYFYEQPKNRFLEIIKEKVPWCISRERVWGTPLPIWKCTKCSFKEGLFSREAIVARSSYLPDGENFELHRPWIDEVLINCPKCQNKMKRELFVLDTWHNSGSAPYSSLSDVEYDTLIPAEFLTEGIDQTRGWAYTLLMLNVIFKKSPQSPFQSFLFTGHVLDEKGNKMSKSLGNVVDAKSLLVSNPVDLVRLYFIWKSSPIEPLNFDIKEMSSRPHQVLSTLFFLHIYYQQNASYDQFQFGDWYSRSGWKANDLTLRSQDIWILTKLKNLIDESTDLLNNCRFHEASHIIEDFIINSLSQTYVPLVRYDLWSDDLDNQERRFTVYRILARCLLTLDIILHPICPFFTEYLYLSCFKQFDSIMMENIPRGEELAVIANTKVEAAFDQIKEISSLSFSLRNRYKLKRRWPLESALIYVDETEFLKVGGVKELLKEQMNIENIQVKELRANTVVEKIMGLMNFEAPIIPSITINRKTVAKIVKGDIGLLIDKFESEDKFRILKQLEEQGFYHFEYSRDKSIDLTITDMDFAFVPATDYVVGEKENVVLLLNTSRNEELITKGLVKDLARNIQQLRKELGYSPTQILDTAYISNFSPEVIAKLRDFGLDLQNLVRVRKIEFSEKTDEAKKSKKIELDGREISIYIF